MGSSAQPLNRFAAFFRVYLAAIPGRSPQCVVETVNLMLQRAEIAAHPAHILHRRSISTVDRLGGLVEGEADVDRVNEQPPGGG